MRRLWKLKEKDDFEEASKQLSIAKRYRARRKRVHTATYFSSIRHYYWYFSPQKFDNRAVVVRPTEMKYWKHISIDEMSEESDDPEDPNTLVIHKLPWCSQGTKV